MSLPSRDSFLNGFDLQLDDDIDDLAVESFWCFVSGGSSFLSAFEWILMMQRLVDVVHDAEAAFAPHEVENMYGSEAVTENGNSTLLIGADEGEVNTSSRILKLQDSVDSDVSNVAEQLGGGALLGLDIDAHISHAADIGDSNAIAATVSMLAAEGAGLQTEFMHFAPYSDVDGFLMAPTPTENGCGVLKDDAAAHVVITNAACSAVQLESLDAPSAADDSDQSGCRGIWGNMNCAATASTSKESFSSENEEAQPGVGLGQVNEDSSLRMTYNVGAEVGTGKSDQVHAKLSSRSVVPGLHAGLLEKGASMESKSPSDPFASSITNAEFRCDPAALCMLTQVIRFRVLAYNPR